jgi:hypothetical protein
VDTGVARRICLERGGSLPDMFPCNGPVRFKSRERQDAAMDDPAAPELDIQVRKDKILGLCSSRNEDVQIDLIA